MAETLKKFGNEIAAATPRGRIGKPEDIIGVCIYLASQATKERGWGRITTLSIDEVLPC